MGLNFQQHDFTDAQRALFDQRVQAQLCEVRHELNRDCYNRDEVSLGAELEFYLVNRQFNPAPINEAILDKARIEGLQEELNQYNLEFNRSINSYFFKRLLTLPLTGSDPHPYFHW